MPSLFLYYVLRGEKRHDRTQKSVPPLELRPLADPKLCCARKTPVSRVTTTEQNGQCRHKYTLIQTSFEMTKSSIGSLEITVDWRRVSWRMANSYKRGKKRDQWTYYFQKIYPKCVYCSLFTTLSNFWVSLSAIQLLCFLQLENFSA